MSVFAFGDSHSILFVHFENISKCSVKEHWLGFNTNLPITMHRFGQEGLDLLIAPITIGNGHQHFIPKVKDVIFYFYGYNDIQQGIWKHTTSNTTIYQLIDTLVKNYAIKLVENETRFGIKTVIPAVYPPPWSNTWHGTEVLGSTEEKYLATVYMNKKLKEMCLERNFYFFDGIYKEIIDEHCKTVKKCYTPDGGHLHQDYTPVFHNIFEKFMETIN